MILSYGNLKFSGLYIRCFDKSSIDKSKSLQKKVPDLMIHLEIFLINEAFDESYIQIVKGLTSG